jgi:hypothetical protein
LVAGPLELAWAAMTAAVVAGPLLLATGAWAAGAVVTALAVVITPPLLRRFHLLTLRWFVFVPAGVVVRDPLGLAETAMFRRATVAGLRLAPAGTTVVDLTAGALGPAVEVALWAPLTVTLAGNVRARQGRPVTAATVLVSPSRPGRLLAEGTRRGYAATPPASTNVSVSS